MKNRVVTVYAAKGMLEAEMVRVLLEAAQVPAMVAQESVGLTFGLTVGPLGEAQVKVLETDYQKALEVIREMEAGNLVLPDEQELSGEEGTEVDSDPDIDMA